MSRAPGVLWSSFSGSAQPSTETPVRITSIGCADGGQLLQRRLHGGGQAAQRLQLGLVAAQLGRVGQLAVHQQVGDLLELGSLGDVEDVVAAVVQVVAACGPRVHSAVLPAVTPDRATDFLGLKGAGAVV